MSALSTCKMQHGAVIIKGGRTLAVAINVDKNDPRNVPQPKTQAAVHAEVAAIRACGDTDLRGATIYVARRNKAGEPMMSAPCVNCQAALRARGIKKVVYTIDKEMTLD